MKVYGLKNCDTCRKALKSLPDAELVDVRATAMPATLVEAALAQFGEDLLNTRSTTWRSLSESERAAPPRDLLAAHPALMKRPLIDTGAQLLLGWGPETRAALGIA